MVGIPDYRQQRLIPRAAQRKTSFYRGSFAGHGHRPCPYFLVGIAPFKLPMSLRDHRLRAPSKRSGTANVNPALTSSTEWPLVSACRYATSKESLSLTFQISPTSPETVSSKPNSLS